MHAWMGMSGGGTTCDTELEEAKEESCADFSAADAAAAAELVVVPLDSVEYEREQ